MSGMLRTDELTTDILRARYGKPLVAALHLCLELERELSAAYERCAKVCDTQIDGHTSTPARLALQYAAAAIRTLEKQ